MARLWKVPRIAGLGKFFAVRTLRGCTSTETGRRRSIVPRGDSFFRIFRAGRADRDESDGTARGRGGSDQVGIAISRDSEGVRALKPRDRFIAARFLACALCLCVALGQTCPARDETFGFDSERPSWRVLYDKERVRLAGHVRSGEVRRSGEAAELVDIVSAAPVSLLTLEHDLPPALVLDELAVALWFQSNQDGAQLRTRVVLPRQVDPRSGKPVEVFVDGSSYRKPGQWQKLDCRDFRTKVRQSLLRVRSEIEVQTGQVITFDQSGMFVDQVVIQLQTGSGTARFAIDDMTFGPIVAAASEKQLQLVTAEEPEPKPEAVVEMGQLLVRDRPFVPRIVPYHGELPEDLSRMHLNVAWVPDYADIDLLGSLAAAGVWSTAVPPRAVDSEGRPLGPASADLTPFGESTASILFWYLGTRIPPEARSELFPWVEQIRNADRTLLRPIMGDVAGLERSYSRELSMLGATRPALFSSLNLLNYRDWLIERRQLARPGTFFWTWVMTEASPALAAQRSAAGLAPLVMEPEQLRLQVYAALAAGCRGIGYWTHTPLDADGPGLEERRLAIALMNIEIQLLEPWLATGTGSTQEPFSATLPPPGNLNALATPGKGMSAQERDQKLANRANQIQTRGELSRNLTAASIGTSYGRLVLPIWYGEDAQFVPGQLAANDATIVIRGAGDVSHVYAISTTRVDSLDLVSDRVAGGRQVKLNKLDLTSVILATDDPGLIEPLKQKISAVAETSAKLTFDLARLKLERTIEVDRGLGQYHAELHEGPRLIASAKRMLQAAEVALRSRDFHESRLRSQECMQLTRILQYEHWTSARTSSRGRGAAVASPHTVCFQTLPDHYEMLARVGRARRTSDGKNLLRSGDFEDIDTMNAERWQRKEVEIPGVRTHAEVYFQQPHSGKSCLHLIAGLAPGQDPPAVISEKPLTIVTPPVTVYKGQIVLISGWVKMAAPSIGSLDGAMLYDSIGGPALALRWHKPADWREFELVREVTETTDLTLTMSLSGLGDIRFDDLKIVALEAADRATGAPEKAAGVPRPGMLDFLKRPFGGKQPPQ